jgi:hypothetical protein
MIKHHILKKFMILLPVPEFSAEDSSVSSHATGRSTIIIQLDII